MIRFLKFLVGVLLLPLCVAATQTVFGLLESIQPSSYSHLPLSTWGLVIGFVLWIFLWFALPRPMRSYVLAHELTHALWAWFFGARVSHMKVGARGGSVQVSKTNFLISLAPYFYPLYTVLAIITYFLLSLFLDLRVYEPFWLGVVGLTWGFHLTFTVQTLMQHQTDIQLNGRLFSYALIYLLNVLGIGLWIVMVASPDFKEFAAMLYARAATGLTFCADSGLSAWRLLRQWRR